MARRTAVPAAMVNLLAGRSKWRLVGGFRGRTPTSAAAVEPVLTVAGQLDSDLAEGLTPRGATVAVRRLRRLLQVDGLGLADLDELVAWTGTPADPSAVHAALTEATEHCQVATVGEVRAAPVIVRGEPVAALLTAGTGPGPKVLAAVADRVAAALDRSRLETARERLREAELDTLRAQISPHFIYNALAAIASFVRSDPDRARALLLDFADFTRYTLSTRGDYTTVADELRSIETYLALERARFGDRLQVAVRVAPEVLGVPVPFLVLQPLVENAVRHGIQPRPGSGRVVVNAEGAGSDCVIEIEDDGAGIDPDRARALLRGEGNGVGLANVDRRLRGVYGAEYGLVVETAVGAGTKVTVRVPRFAPGVHQ